MQMSKKLVSNARYLYSNSEALNGMKKYALIDELRMYGVTINPNSDLDTECVREIYKCVLERVVKKYEKV